VLREDAPFHERVRFRANESRARSRPLQVITVGTKNGARLLGAADEIGTLMPGHEASFIVLDKDPSADIRNTETIRAVWKAGKQVSAGPLAATRP
jgi:imidazolonepropionase-like amidohydrolase